MELVWLAIAALIPLVINPWQANAFELPKATLLKGLGLALVALIGVGRASLPRDTWQRVILGFTLALGGALMLATIFSTSVRASF